MRFLQGHLDLIQITGYSIKYQLEGVHLPDAGAIYALAAPNGYVWVADCRLFSSLTLTSNDPDIRQLSLMIPEFWRNDTAHAVVTQLQERIEKLERQIYGLSPDEGNGGKLSAFCYL